MAARCPSAGTGARHGQRPAEGSDLTTFSSLCLVGLPRLRPEVSCIKFIYLGKTKIYLSCKLT